MEDRDPDDVEALEGVIEPSQTVPKPSFPVVGTDRTPTPEMLAKGVHGAGSWNLTDDSVQVAYEEHHRQVKEDKDERRRFFNESAKDALADAIKFHHQIVLKGLEVMERVNEPDEDKPVTSKDMSILSMAQKSSKELADRGMGRAAAAQQESENKSFLSMLTVRKPDA